MKKLTTVILLLSSSILFAQDSESEKKKPENTQVAIKPAKVKPTTGKYLSLIGMYGLTTANGFLSEVSSGAKKTFNTGNGFGLSLGWLFGPNYGIGISGMYTKRSMGAEDRSAKLVYNSTFAEVFIGYRGQQYIAEKTQLLVEIGPFYGVKIGTWTADATVSGSTINANLTSVVGQNDNIGIITRLGILQSLTDSLFVTIYGQVDMGFTKVIDQTAGATIRLATSGILGGVSLGIKL